MGDRVSIQFECDGEKSVVLFHHWGGMDFVKEAKKFVKALPPRSPGDPLSRREPRSIMVLFIKSLKNTSSVYLAATEYEGDNSDNGHHIIQLH